ncbi:MAG TPA: DUF2281 domain-containing protein [Chloroflexota bacterium]|nr:DUF2281 domain-containing protein [Chloroflexota bacterium]HUM70491.1 DUF2281 domain-containing protein [Chloroflexota bacterium]
MYGQTITITQINERLQKLSSEKLIVVYEFVSYLADKERGTMLRETDSALQTMLASEVVLKRDWDLPEEDEAWASL